MVFHPQKLCIIGCLSLVLISCRHTQSAKEKPAPLTDENRDLDSDKSQTDLWSPARRQANASFFYLTGEYEALNRNIPRARKFFENAYNLDPNPRLAVKMIEMQAGEDVDKALNTAKKMVLLYPEYGDLRLLLGRFLTATGDFEKAEQQLKKAVELDPKKLEAHVFLLHLYYTQQKYQQAIPVAIEMLKVNSDFSEGWAQLAKLYLISKQPKLAVEAAKRALLLSPSDPEQVHLNAVALEKNGNFKEAVTQYDFLLRLNSTLDEVIVNMVGLYKQLGSLDDALKNLQATEKAVGSQSPGVRLQMTYIYWEQQKFESATELLDQLARENPQSERITFMSGIGQERTKQVKEALETFRSFDPSSDYYVPARHRAISILRRQGDVEGALAIIREVASSQLGSAADFYVLGAQVLGAEKRYSEAVKFLNEGIVRFADRSDLIFLKAVNEERAGNIQDCKDTLDALLKKDPEHAAGHNFLGYLLAERKEDLEKAEFHIKKALEIKPDDGYYLDSLGWVYYQQGKLEKALETLLKANDYVPNEGVVLEHIGDTYKALGQEAKAQEFYGKASKTKLDDRDLQRIMQKFDSGK